MVMTESTMMALGTNMPTFELKSTDGEMFSSSELASAKASVILFICNHCPYVKHIAPALKTLADRYMAEGVAFVAINSNDTAAYPDDDLPHMAEEKASRGYAFPYLLDETQAVATSFAAACTPDIFVFDADQKLVYRGQFDGTRPTRISSGNYDSGEQPANGSDLAEALDLVLAGQALPAEQTPSIGCNIKWKPGNEPTYFPG